MGSIGGYRRDIRLYDDIKDKLWRIVGKLDDASNSAGHIKSELSSNYRINNNPTKTSTRIDTLNRSIGEEADYIRNVVIPAIEGAISYSEREIDRLEEEERRRREEEEDDDD